MLHFKDVSWEDDSYYISLSKLFGKNIKDVVAYISGEFGDYTLAVNKLVFEDDSYLWFEGEHDLPYVVEGGMEPSYIDYEMLERLYHESEELLDE